MEYPAQDAVDCTNSNQHLHQDVQMHNCDLCEYQVTFWVNHTQIGATLPKYDEIESIELQDAPTLNSYSVVNLRGPPTC